MSWFKQPGRLGEGGHGLSLARFGWSVLGCGSSWKHREPQCSGSLVRATSPCSCCCGVRASPTPGASPAASSLLFPGISSSWEFLCCAWQAKRASLLVSLGCNPCTMCIGGAGTGQSPRTKLQQSGLRWRCAVPASLGTLTEMGTGAPCTSGTRDAFTPCREGYCGKGAGRPQTREPQLQLPEITVRYILYTPKKV